MDILIAFVVVILVVGVIIYNKGKKDPNQPKFPETMRQVVDKGKSLFSQTTTVPQQKLDAAALRLDKIEQRLATLETAIESLRYAAKQNSMSVDKHFNGIADTIIQMQHELNMLKYRPEPKPVPPPFPKKDVPKTNPHTNISHRTFYASRFNTDMNGFSVDSLSPDPMGCCYEITIESSNEASYKIVENESVKGEMISVFNQLVAPACSWDEMPACISAIANDTPGRLYRNGNNWLITRKAKIKLL